MSDDVFTAIDVGFARRMPADLVIAGTYCGKCCGCGQWGAYYLMKQFESLSFNRKDAKRPVLFLTMGEREGEADFNRFSELLRKGDMIRLESKVYKDLEHMGTAVPTFEEWISQP